MRELRQSIRKNDELWGWGTSDGLVPWRDSRRATMIALWQSESRAREENEGPEADADEGVVRLTVAELQAKVPVWTRNGVRRYGLEPQGGDILYTLSPNEFLSFLTTGLAVARRLP